MKGDAQIKRLGEVILDMKDGGTPSRRHPEYFGGDVNWCVVKDIQPLITDTTEKLTEQGLKHSSAKVWPVNSVIISLGATIGQVGLARVPTATKQGISGIVVDSDIITPEYLVYVLNHNRDFIQGLASGTTIKEVRPPKLKEGLSFRVPPLAEQQRIIAILDEAFEGIAIAKANAEKNLKNLAALGDSALDALLDGGDRVPIVQIGDVAQVYDGPHATPKTVDSGPLFLGIRALCDGELDLSVTRHVTPDDYVQWTRRVKPEAGDVVFSYETRLGQAAIIPDGLECCLGRRMGLIRADRSQLHPDYLTHLYVSPGYRRYLESKTVRGATVDRLSIKEFPSFEIPLPSLDEQRRIASAARRLRFETAELDSVYQRKLDALDTLKKSLLNEAFVGNL